MIALKMTIGAVDNAWWPDFVRNDMLAAHAYQMAIQDRIDGYEEERAYQGDILTNAAIKSLRDLQNEAAAIHAKLLAGETKEG
jgi:hypothetical protein